MLKYLYPKLLKKTKMEAFKSVSWLVTFIGLSDKGYWATQLATEKTGGCILREVHEEKPRRIPGKTCETGLRNFRSIARMTLRKLCNCSSLFITDHRTIWLKASM